MALQLQNFDSREKYSIFNTLNAIPLILKDKAVIIDLINEISVIGRIESADGSMNIRLTEVVYIDRNNLQYDLNCLMVPSRKIRQINIPDSIDIAKELNEFFNKITMKRNFRKNERKGTLKAKRATQKHKEILQEINATKTEK